jgi:O-antigen/teichoic acid export membrane protein
MRPKTEAVPSRGATDERRSIATNTAFAFLVQFLSSVFTIGLTLFLVRALSPHGYGVLVLASTIAGFLLLPADFGVTQSTARFVAQYYEKKPLVAVIVANALKLKLLLTGGACVLLLATAGKLASLWGNPELAWPLRAMAIALFGQSVMGLLCGVANAQGRIDLNLRVYLTESVVETFFAVILVLAGAGAAGAAAGKAAGYIAATVIAVLMTVGLVGRSAVSLRVESNGWMRTIARYGGALILVDSAFVLFDQIDVVLIAALLSTTAVGIYAAPLKLVSFLMLPAAAISAGVAPRLATEAGREAEKSAFLRAVRLIAVFQGFFIAPLLVWATPIVDVLLGADKYGRSIAVLRAFIPFVFFSGFGILFSITANYLGQARRRIPVALLTVLINLGIDLTLIPRIGVVAGAIGTDVAYVFYTLAHGWICTRIIQIPLRPMLAPLISVGFASAAMAGSLVVFGTGHLSVGRIILGGIIASVVYLVIACLTHGIRVVEIRGALQYVVWNIRRAKARLRLSLTS